MKCYRTYLLAALFLSIVSNLHSICLGSPFPHGPPGSFSNNFRTSEAVLWGRWTQSSEQRDLDGQQSEFEILAIAKDTADEYTLGQKIVVDPYWNRRQTSTLILFKKKFDPEDDYRWFDSEPVSREAWSYAIAAPSINLLPSDRLPYYVKHLNASDKFIRSDAVAELRQAKLNDLIAMKDHMDREFLVRSLADPDVTAYQMDLFGILLGICGTESDGEVLLSMIENDQENRPQPSHFQYQTGIITGFLLLQGEKGITSLETSIWNVDHHNFADFYAVMKALTYLLESPPENLPRNQLLATLREMLKRPDVTDLIIYSLAKAEDWEILDEILKLYDDKEYDQPNINREIIRYVWNCAHSWDGKVTSELPDYVSTAKKALKKFEQSNPKIYQQAVRGFQMKQGNQ